MQDFMESLVLAVISYPSQTCNWSIIDNYPLISNRLDQVFTSSKPRTQPPNDFPYKGFGGVTVYLYTVYKWSL